MYIPIPLDATKEINCIHCGKPFLIHRKKDGSGWQNRKVCDECNKPAKFTTLTCQKCGKLFQVGRRPSNPSKFLFRKYCDECAKPIPYKEITCKGCGKIEKTFRGEADFGVRVYCKECQRTQNYVYKKEHGISPDGQFLTQTCEKCGKTFQVGKSKGKNGDFFLRRRFCIECSKAKGPQPRENVCKQCGKVFTNYTYRRLLCDDCANPVRPDFIVRKCIKCGKEFKVTKILRKDGRFWGYSRKELCDYCGGTGLKEPEFNAFYETRTCSFCDKEFTVLKSKDQKYCSTECSDKGRAETLRQTSLARFGVEYPCLLPQCKCSDSTSHSKVNIDFENMLESLGIEFESELKLGNYFYDIHILNTNLVIEINPTFTHSTKSKVYKSIPKDYHKQKSENAEKFGYQCIHVWDWDDWSKIIKTLVLVNTDSLVDLVKCTKIDKNIAKEFYDEFSLTSFNDEDGLLYLAISQEGKILQVATFVELNNSNWELVSICNKFGYSVSCETLLNYFRSKYKPNSLVFYKDLSKPSMIKCEELGFRFSKTLPPQKHMCNYRTYEHTLFSKMDRQDTTEKDWLPLYDCGWAKYIL